MKVCRISLQGWTDVKLRKWALLCPKLKNSNLEFFCSGIICRTEWWKTNANANCRWSFPEINYFLTPYLKIKMHIFFYAQTYWNSSKINYFLGDKKKKKVLLKLIFLFTVMWKLYTTTWNAHFMQNLKTWILSCFFFFFYPSLHVVCRNLLILNKFLDYNGVHALHI